MRLLHTSHAVVIVLVVLWSGSPLRGAEQDKKPPDKGALHTVDARVTYSAGTSTGTNVLAERQPGFFKVPAGQVARNFKYYFADPKSGIERDKLNNHTIYCETTKSWVDIPADPKTLELPPGDYKFVVGGLPGASGTLNFRTFASSGVAPPPPDPTKKHHPPPPSDTTKADIKRDRLHPGGEGKRKVQVHVDATITDSRGVTRGSGDLSATLTVSEGAIRLDFDTERGENPNKKTDRWEGTLTIRGQVLTVKGSTLKYYAPVVAGAPDTTWRGTFEGHLEGTVLKGTTAAHMVIPDVRGDVTADLKAEWSIKDFAK